MFINTQFCVVICLGCWTWTKVWPDYQMWGWWDRESSVWLENLLGSLKKLCVSTQHWIFLLIGASSLCQLRLDALDLFSHEVVAECDIRPHIYLYVIHICVFKQRCVNVWACHTPFACRALLLSELLLTESSLEIHICGAVGLPPPCPPSTLPLRLSA